uniref:Uncharacterized protein n=1 Tax=Felis catus TaxID=9685 RepID=A0ABI7YMM5_FELCA
MSRASLTSSSSWYSASCCCITSRISVISCSLASSILRNLSRSPAIVSSSSRIRSSAALAWGGVGAARSGRPPQVTGRSPPGCAPRFPSSCTRGQAPGAGRGQTPSPRGSGGRRAPQPLGQARPEGPRPSEGSELHSEPPGGGGGGGSPSCLLTLHRGDPARVSSSRPAGK